MKTLDKIEAGDPVYVSGNNGFCVSSYEIVSNITFQYDEYTGLPYNVIWLDRRKFDSRTGRAMNPPLAYYITTIKSKSSITTKAKFVYDVVLPNIIWILDIGEKCMSVTNDMEAVLNSIISELEIDDIKKYKIIYRDSDGIWDGVTPVIDENLKVVNVNFYPLRAVSINHAIQIISNNEHQIELDLGNTEVQNIFDKFKKLDRISIASVKNKIIYSYRYGADYLTFEEKNGIAIKAKFEDDRAYDFIQHMNKKGFGPNIYETLKKLGKVKIEGYTTVIKFK